MTTTQASNVDDAIALMQNLSVTAASAPVLNERSGNETVPTPVPADPTAVMKSQKTGLEDDGGVVEQVLSDEQQNEYLNAMFDEQASIKLKKKLPSGMTIRKNLLKTKLMKHQEDGVKWLITQELNEDPNPFFKKMEYSNGNIRYRCSLTGRNFVDLPAPIKGAILADDMGLGKTIQSLALVLSNPPNEASELDPYVTLVVAPKSAIPNWKEQTEAHVKKGNLSAVIYEGNQPKREKLVPQIHNRKWNIVIVTYETLAADFKKLKAAEKDTDLPPPRTLFSLNFHRIILDEAHNIRNSSTKTFAAAINIQATHKLALTGTPFVNKPEDIYSLLRFLNVEPLNNINVFKDEISKMISEGRPCGLARLRTVMMHVSLRRTKDLLELDLPEKSMILRHIPFKDDDHKSFHDAMYMVGRVCLQVLSSSGDPDNKKIFNQYLFQIISRVRQACCSCNLFTQEFRHGVQDLAKKVEAAHEEEELSVEAAIGFLESFSVLSTAETNKGSGKETAGSDVSLSPKIKALLHFIGHDLNDGEKGVVFSSFTSFLDLIEEAFNAENIKFTRLDGSMSIDARASAINSFENDDDGPRVILCSIKAAGSGINLTRGNNCFLVDPWFNRAVEDQAADRVYRLGQDRPVKVVRLIMKDSVEERLFALQKSKQMLGKGAMEKLSKDEEEKLKVMTFRSLMEIDESGLRDDFEDDDAFIIDDVDMSF